MAHLVGEEPIEIVFIRGGFILTCLWILSQVQPFGISLGMVLIITGVPDTGE